MRNVLILLLAIVLTIWLAALCGCAGASAPIHHDPRESWDQQNLKRYDDGCPTSIYWAPGGVLELCPIT
jgi:hypothetical protein